MAGRWSSNDVVAEYRDLQANAMSVNYTGQYALLAGKRYIGLVDLNNPSQSIKKVQRQSKWDISAIQWNPHLSNQNYFVSVCNEMLDVCLWTDTTYQSLGSTKAHTRNIRDLDWSPEDCNWLATCSYDNSTHFWDIRDFRKPTLSLETVGSVSQVKWNKINSNLLATSQDSDIRLWDIRKGNNAVQYISAHSLTIHGLDWNPTSEFHLSTACQDSSIKLWDVSNARQAEMKITTSAPVWRARYTPFGRGLITIVVPQLRRGENSLFLWHLDDTKQPVHTFVGHTDVVLEFQWRKMPDGDSGDQQLVTWSKDQSLRLWKIDTQIQKLVGHEMPGDIPTMFESDQIEVGNAVMTAAPPGGEHVKKPDTLPTVLEHITLETSLNGHQEVKSPQQPLTLQQEFDLVNVYIPNVHVEEMDAINRTFTVTAGSGKQMVKLEMRFPEAYPTLEPPRFIFGKATTIDNAAQTKLIKVLRDSSLNHVKHSRSCIEPCMRLLVSNLEALTNEDRRSPEDSDVPYQLPKSTVMDPPDFLPIISTYNSTYSAIQDSSVPFPRTSGARFCGAGFLVCFTRKTELESSTSVSRRMSSTPDLTPRAMAALSAFGRPGLTRTPSASRPLFSFTLARSPPSDGTVSISNYYKFIEKKRQRSKRLKDAELRQGKEANSPSKKELKTGPVIIYNIDCLLPIQKQLAENYVIDSYDVPGMCRKNAAVAAAAGRKDLVQVWSLAELATSKALRPGPDPDRGAPWAYHPFGRRLLNSLVKHYTSIHDVQTLAMLCCAYGNKNDGQKAPPQAPNTTSSKSHTKSPPEISVTNNNIDAPPGSLSPIHDTSLNGWSIAKVRRSNSWSDIVDDYKYGEEPKDPAEVEKEHHEQNCKLVESKQEILYDQFKKVYADILYRWDLLEKRAQVLKYVSVAPSPHTGLEFNNECQSCRNEARGPQCWHCKGHVFRCSVCRVVVKGISNFCLACGHGGHSTHMQEWFKTHTVCPTGCGCECLDNNPMSEET